MTRREALLLLARSLDDLVWEPETWSGKLVRKQAGPGLVGSRRRACSCERGWRTDRFRRRFPCGECGGVVLEDPVTGRVVPRPGKGYVLVDPYDRERRPIATTETPSAPARVVSRLCDRCGGSGTGGAHLVNGRPGTERRDPCETCGGSGRREWSPFELHISTESGGDPVDAQLHAIDFRDRAGDYTALERALDQLRDVDRPAYRLFRAVHVLAAVDAGELDEDAETLLRGAVLFLEERMPEQLRVPSFVAFSEKAKREQLRQVKGRTADRKVLRERDREIRRLYRQEDWTVPELARVFGLQKSRLYEILDRDEAA